MFDSMKNHRAFRTALLRGAACMAAAVLTSCIATDPYGYGSYDNAYYGGGGGGYGSRPYYGSGYYGSGYSHGSGYRCSVCGHNPCTCSHRGHDDRHDHGGHDDATYRLSGGSQRGKPNRPEGSHSADWYRKRGYNLHNYTVKNDDGDVVHKAHKTGSSSQKRGGNHKDDKHKH